MDLRVQRFHAAVEHFRKSGVCGNLGDRQAFFFEQLGRPAGRNELDAKGTQRAAEVRDSGLIRNAQQRPLDFRHYPLMRSCCIFLRKVLRLMPSISAASDWFPWAWPMALSIIGFSMFFSTISYTGVGFSPSRSLK